MAMVLTGLVAAAALTAPAANADAWTQDLAGVDTVGAAVDTTPAANYTSSVASRGFPGSMAYMVTGGTAGSPVATPVDDNTLYAVGSGNPTIVKSVNTNTAVQSNLFTVWMSLGGGANAGTMAVDSGYADGTPGYYFTTWGAGSRTNNDQPIYFWPVGSDVPTKLYWVPQPIYFGAGGYQYFSSAVVNQVNGNLILGPGECDDLTTNTATWPANGVWSASNLTGDARWTIFDPNTLTTYYSGPLWPAGPSDNLWTNGGTINCTGPGYVASGMSILPNGDPVVLVQGTSVAIPASNPINTTGVDIPAGSNAVAFLVEIHPSMNNNPWTYSIMTMVNINAGPNGSGKNANGVSNAAGLDASGYRYGSSFMNGQLYVATNTNSQLQSGMAFSSINPLTGQLTYIGNDTADGSPSIFDLGSDQTAGTISGYVYNDTTGSGSFTTQNPVQYVDVGLYEQGGNSGYTSPTLIGTQETNDLGQYTFLVPYTSTTDTPTYYVRLIQPTLTNAAGDAVPAVETAGTAVSTDVLDATNQATLTCVNGGNPTTFNADNANLNNAVNAGGSPTGTTCMDVNADGTTTNAPAEGVGNVGDPATWGDYGTVTMANTWGEPEIDFNISTASTSFGDATNGPATIAAGAPMHNNTGTANVLQLGSSLGNYPAPATDGTSHNNTDDGVFIHTPIGNIPLQGTMMASGTSYNMQATLSGSQAANATVDSWTAAPGTGQTWSADSSWTVTGANGTAAGTMAYGALGGSAANVQARVSASTQSSASATNSASGYYAEATSPYTFTTPGEVEDYTYNTVPAIIRPAAVGGTPAISPTITVGATGVPLANVTATPVIGAAQAASTTAPTMLSAPAETGWKITGATVINTATGADASADITTPFAVDGSGNATISVQPKTGEDLIVEFTYSMPPDPSQSSISWSATTSVASPMTSTTGTAGTPVEGYATIENSNGTLLSGVTVDLAVASGSSATLQDASGNPITSCVTDSTGQCPFYVADDKAEAATVTGQIDGIPGYVNPGSTGITVTFSHSTVVPGSSYFTVDPAANTADDSTWVTVGGTYTVTVYANDGEGNPVAGLTNVALAGSGTDITVSAVKDNGDGSYTATVTSQVAQSASTVSATVDASGAKVTENQPQANGGTVTDAPIPFNAGPVSPTCTAPAGVTNPLTPGLVADPSTGVAAGSSSAGSTLTATFTDQYCNPVADGTVVTWTPGSSTATVTPTASSPVTATTSVTSGGVATATLTDTKVETANPTATVPMLTTPYTTPVGFVAGAPDAANTYIDASPTTVAADGNSKATVTATVADENGNPISGATVSFFNFGSATASASSCTTVSDGTCSITMTDTTVETVTPTATVTATSGTLDGLTSRHSVSFESTSVSAGNSSYTLTPCANATGTSGGSTVPVADGTQCWTLTVTAKDGETTPQPVSGAAVNITVSPNVTLSPANGTSTGADGTATYTLTSKIAFAYPVSVNAGGTTINITPASQAQVATFVPGPVSPTCTAPAGVTNPLTPGLTASPSSGVAAGKPGATGTGTSTLTATFTDEYCNPVADGTVVTWTPGSSTATLTPAASPSVTSGGVATATLSDTAAETANPTATVAGLATPYTTPVGFVANQVVIGTQCTIGTTTYTVGTVVASPNTQSVGGTSSLTVLLADGDCNPIVGATADFTTSGNSAVIPGTTTPATVNPATTGSNGLATSSVTDSKDETVTIGGTYDASNATSNGVAGNYGKGALVSDTTSITTATAPAATGVSMVQFTVGMPSATNSSVTISPSTQTAGTNVTVTVTVKDGSNNPITGLAASDIQVTGAYVAGSGTAGASPTFVVDPNSFAPLGNGQYTYQATSDLVGTFNVTAVAENVTIAQQPQARFVPGGVCVDNCTPQNPNADNGGYTGFVVTLDQQQANGTAKDQVTAFAYDTMGNPVDNAPVVLNDTTNGALAGLLTPPSATANTGSNGQAVLSFSTTKIGSYTVAGTINNLVPNANTTTLDGATVQSGPGGTLTFVSGTVSAAASKLTVTPTTQAVGSPMTVTVDVNDGSGNPVADVAPTVAVNPTNATLSALTQTAPGVWTGTLNSTVAGAYQVSATVPTSSGNQAVGGSPQNVTFTATTICIAPACTPQPGVTNVTGIVVSPNGVVANGTAVDVATVSAYDEYGNPVLGATVTSTPVEGTLIQVIGSGLTGSATSSTPGQIALTYASDSATAQHANVTIVDPLNPSAGPQAVPPSPIELDFVSAAIDPSNSTFTVTTATGAANAPQTADTPFTLSAHAEDANGNAVSGATITFSSTAGATLSAPTCKTDPSGDCSVTVNSTTAGTYQVGATAPDSAGVSQPLGTGTGVASETSPQNVTWTADKICIAPSCTPQPGVTNVTSVTVKPNGVANDGTTQDVATVSAYDEWGNPIVGAAVASTATGSNAGSLSTQPTILPTNSNGQTTIGYTSLVAGSYSADVTLVDPSNTAAGPQAVPPTPITLLFGSGLVDSTTSYFTVSPASPLTVGEGAANTYTVTVHANDAMSQPVPGAVISFSTAAGPVWAATPATCTTSASGICALTVYSTVAGTYTISVVSGSTVIAPQTIGGDQVAWQSDDVCASGCTPQPGVTKFTSVTMGTNNMVADGMSQDSAIVHAYDQWGNPVSGVTVGVTPDSTLNVVTSFGGQAYTDSTGTMTIYFTSTKAGAHTASFTVQKIASTPQIPTGSPLTDINFVPGTADASDSTLKLSTTSATVGSTVTATATINDANGNAVPAGTVVTFTVDQNATLTSGTGSPAQTVTAATNASGQAIVTLTDQKADNSTDPGSTPVTVHAMLGTTDLGGAGSASAASPQQVSFTAGSISVGDSTLTVTPAGTMTAGVPSVDGGSYTVTVTARDGDKNPITTLDPSTIVFTTNDTTGGVTISSPVTSDGKGDYSVTYTSTLADTQPDGVTPISGATQLTASVTVAGSSPVADASGNTTPSTHFVPGTADPGPVVCPDPSTQTGTQYTVSTNTQTDGATVILKARVTDDKCNPIDGVPVTFTTNSNGQILSVANGDGTLRTVAGTPVGTAVTGTTFPTQTAVVDTDPGNAWVVLTDYTAPDTTITHATIPVNGTPTDLVGTTAATSSPQTITWTTSGPAINPTCPVPPIAGQTQGTGISVTPGTVTIPETSTASVLVTDANCNPLPGVTVNLTVNNNGKLSAATATTGDGTNGTTLGVATVTVSDTTPETITVQATIPSSDAPTTPVTGTNAAKTGADVQFLQTGTPSIATPANGTTIVTATPTITGGGGVPGDTVTVSDANGNPVCTTTVTSSDGSWSCVTTPLPDGSITLTAVQTDTSGNPSPASNPVTVTVDTTPPAITNPTSGSTVATDKPVISGTGATPGSTVTVKDANGNPVAGCDPATVNSDGTWTCTPTSALPTGSNTLTPVVTDPDGNTNAGTPVTVTVTPTTPAITGPASGSTVATDEPPITGTGATPGSTVTVTDGTGNTVCTATVPVTDTTGDWTCTPTSPLPAGSNTLTPTLTDAGGNQVTGTPVTVTVDTTPAQITSPADGSTVITDVPPISGAGALPGATVTVKDGDGNTICSTTVAAGGNWTCTPKSPLPTGTVTLTPTQVDSQGNQGPAGDPRTITVNTTAPSIDPLGPTNNPQPPISGTGTVSGDKVTVKDGDGSTVCTATIQADGSWSCTPSNPLPDGTHNLTATEQDSSGNNGTPSAPVAVVIDAALPKPPVLNQTDGTTISGTADPGTTIQIWINGAQTTVPGCENLVADANGNYSCTPTTPMANGTVFFVKAVNSLGTVSLPSNTVTVGTIPITVQTGGVPAPGFGFGFGAAGVLALVGLLLAVAVIRRRDEEQTV